jgi:hypothetical protein
VRHSAVVAGANRRRLILNVGQHPSFRGNPASSVIIMDAFPLRAQKRTSRANSHSFHAKAWWRLV